MLELSDFTERLRSYLEEYKGFPVDYPADKFAFAAELVQTRIKVLADAYGLLKFLITADEDLVLDEKSAKKNLKEDAVEVLNVSIEEVEGIDANSFTASALETALQGRLIEQMELKPRKAYGALRVAVSGAAVSPPLVESMELLGKESTLARLRSALAQTPYAAAE